MGNMPTAAIIWKEFPVEVSQRMYRFWCDGRTAQYTPLPRQNGTLLLVWFYAWNVVSAPHWTGIECTSGCPESCVADGLKSPRMEVPSLLRARSGAQPPHWARFSPAPNDFSTASCCSLVSEMIVWPDPSRGSQSPAQIHVCALLSSRGCPSMFAFVYLVWGLVLF